MQIKPFKQTIIPSGVQMDPTYLLKRRYRRVWVVDIARGKRHQAAIVGSAEDEEGSLRWQVEFTELAQAMGFTQSDGVDPKDRVMALVEEKNIVWTPEFVDPKTIWASNTNLQVRHKTYQHHGANYGDDPFRQPLAQQVAEIDLKHYFDTMPQHRVIKEQILD